MHRSEIPEGEAESARIRTAAEDIVQDGESKPRSARDPVNLPMIGNWVEALGDGNPVYTSRTHAERSAHGELVAPPAMVQVWTMGGLQPQRVPEDPLRRILEELDGAGFTSVVATNCEQSYHRYLKHGEHVSVSTTLESVVGPKRTGLGEGWFVTSRDRWYVGDEQVAEMMFRMLKFRPKREDTGAEQASPQQPESEAATRAEQPVLPSTNRDTAFFWDGAANGELRIQRCGRCGLLRHPPGPMCPECGACERTYMVASGRGEVYSYVVHHRPQLPGKHLPLVIALVELEEGVRMLGELHGLDSESVHIGLPVEVRHHRVDERITLPCWSPLLEGRSD